MHFKKNSWRASGIWSKQEASAAVAGAAVAGAAVAALAALAALAAHSGWCLRRSTCGSFTGCRTSL